ncbi:hypothetical protein [Cryobacterium serini]|uniref:Uncharacterized protein n=1 Tax=Cryobacterium serini TaxID=1259201 RepID=A0A4R9BW06_9MICO|nr:hypothetical protein [Cryobacterium serini]TFD91370.1 hypothetical protein E3T51_01275 [Cryobacterium serini]
MNAVTVVVVLIVLGGVLPLLGLGRVALRAHRSLPKADRVSAAEQIEEGQRTGYFAIGPFLQAAQMTDTAPVLEWSKVRWDLGLVGGGIPAGTIGSVFAVFL